MSSQTLREILQEHFTGEQVDPIFGTMIRIPFTKQMDEAEQAITAHFIACLPERPGLHVDADLEEFKIKVKGLSPMANQYKEIEREHVFSMGVKAGRATTIDQTLANFKRGEK